MGAIHDATSKGGNYEKTKTLLEENSGLVSSRNDQGETPLHCAAAGGRKDIVEMLLAHRADINARDNKGRTPLHAAAVGVSWQISPRAWAGGKDPFEVIEFLVAHAADVNAKDHMGMTPLHLHCSATFVRDRDKETVGLLARLSEVNARDNDTGWTPLHHAAAGGHVDKVKVLLAHGAQVDAESDGGHTPLRLAADRAANAYSDASEHTEVARTLFSSGANINVKSPDGRKWLATRVRLREVNREPSKPTPQAMTPEPTVRAPKARRWWQFGKGKSA